eukprot:s3743_g2.t1
MDNTTYTNCALNELQAPKRMGDPDPGLAPKKRARETRGTRAAVCRRCMALWRIVCMSVTCPGTLPGNNSRS